MIAAVIGVALQLIAPRYVPTPDPTSAQTFAGSFQRGTLIRIAFAEAAAIVGFVCFLVTGSWIVYGVGFVIAAFGMWQAAPRTARLASIQHDIRTAGSDLAVVRVLNTTRLAR